MIVVAMRQPPAGLIIRSKNVRWTTTSSCSQPFLCIPSQLQHLCLIKSSLLALRLNNRLTRPLSTHMSSSTLDIPRVNLPLATSSAIAVSKVLPASSFASSSPAKAPFATCILSICTLLLMAKSLVIPRMVVFGELTTQFSAHELVD